MALPVNRTEFKAYCLRRLGDGAIDINVTDTQVEDRIDDALTFYSDYHYDATEATYFKHQITAADIANEYITVPDNIIGLIQVYDISSAYDSGLWHSDKYQLLAGEISSLTNGSLVNYFFTNYRLSEIEALISGSTIYRYNRHINRLYLDTNWAKIIEGRYLLAKAYKVIDPAVFADIWKDQWLGRYATALIKRQWGSNLSKFEGMQLPGGLTYNGSKIYDDAVEEIRTLEDDVINNLSIPLAGIVG